MIYLVEDDESIRELVVYTLKSQGMEAKGFERPSQFWKELDKEIPSLILLDVMLPEEDGISILKKLRTRPDTRKLPIIMLTAKGSEYDVVMGHASVTTTEGYMKGFGNSRMDRANKVIMNYIFES